MTKEKKLYQGRLGEELVELVVLSERQYTLRVCSKTRTLKYYFISGRIQSMVVENCENMTPAQRLQGIDRQAEATATLLKIIEHFYDRIVSK